MIQSFWCFQIVILTFYRLRRFIKWHSRSECQLIQYRILWVLFLLSYCNLFAKQVEQKIKINRIIINYHLKEFSAKMSNFILNRFFSCEITTASNQIVSTLNHLPTRLHFLLKLSFTLLKSPILSI